MSTKDEDVFRAWERLKQRFKPGLAARQGIVMAELLGLVARPAKSTGETVALLTDMDRKIKLVEDVTWELVSKMHARSVLVRILDPVTRQHTATNHSKSYEALKKIVQEFSNNSTTGQEAMQIGRVEAGAPAPTTGWQPSVAETTTVQDLLRIRSRVPGLSQPARARAHTNGARATTTGQRAATTGCTKEVQRRRVRVLMVPSRRTRRVTASLEEKDSVMTSATPAVEIISHEIAPMVEEKEDSGHWKPRRLEKSHHW